MSLYNIVIDSLAAGITSSDKEKQELLFEQIYTLFYESLTGDQRLIKYFLSELDVESCQQIEIETDYKIDLYLPPDTKLKYNGKSIHFLHLIEITIENSILSLEILSRFL